MLDPYFLQKLNDFRAKTVDERTPHFHPSSVPAVFNRWRTDQGLTQHNNTHDYQTAAGIPACLNGLVEDQYYFTNYTGAYRTHDHRTEPTEIIHLKLEENLTGTYSGEGFSETHGYFSTGANNDTYQGWAGMSIPVKNPTDTDIIIPAGALYAGVSSGSTQKPGRIVVSTPDATNGSVTSVTHTTLHNSNSNNWQNHYSVSQITVPANSTIILHVIGGTHTFYHNTTYDVDIGMEYCVVRGMKRFMNASTTPEADGYVDGSYNSVLKPDYQVLMNLHSRKYLNFVDVFNGNSDIKKVSK